MSVPTLNRTATVVRDRIRRTISFGLTLVSISLPLFVSSDESSAGPTSGRSAGGREYESSYTRPFDHLSSREQEQAREALRRAFGTDSWQPTPTDRVIASAPYDATTLNKYRHLKDSPSLREHTRRIVIPPKAPKEMLRLRQSSHLSSLHSLFEEGFRDAAKNLADNGKSAEEGEKLLMEDVRDKSFEHESRSSNNTQPRGMSNKRQKLLMDVALREFSKHMKDAPPDLIVSRDSDFDLRLKK